MPTKYIQTTKVPVLGNAVKLSSANSTAAQRMNRNKPLGYPAPPEPETYSSNLIGLKNRPKSYPYPFSIIESPFNSAYVFHNYTIL